MNKLRFLSVVGALVLFAFPGYAQYDHMKPFAVGIRLSPDGVGANLRYFFNDHICLEGQLNASGGTSGGSGKSKTGVLLGEYLIPLYTPDFRLFLGAGFHYGSWERYKNISVADNYSGYDFIVGLEYAFSAVPISVSLDYKPAVNYVSGTTFFPNNSIGLGGRYAFGSRKKHTNKEKSAK